MNPPVLPWVTACVPAYRSEAFVAETLASLDAQSYPNLRIVVSVDPSDDDTEGVCRSFSSRRPIDVVVQSSRRGWVANTNAALDRVDTELFFICPHDDLVLPEYVSALQELLCQRPDAVASYCDVHTFGKVEEMRRVTGLDGTLANRLSSLLSQRREGVPWRGLTRSAVLREGLRMRDNRHSGFHSHVVWLVELLLKGPLLHHPAPLYRRNERMDDHSVVVGWESWTSEERSAAVTASTRECFKVLAGANLSLEEWESASEALLERFRRRWPKQRESTNCSAEPGRQLEVEEELRREANRMRFLASGATKLGERTPHARRKAGS